MCSQENSILFKLQATPTVQSFKGLGFNRAVLAHPIPVTCTYLNRTINVSFYIVPQQDFQTIIGTEAMAALNVIPDPVSKKVLDRELLALPIQQVSQQHATVSGVDDSKSDEQLIWEAKNHFDSLTSHLDPQQAEELWELFKEFSDMWLRPTGGKFTGFKGSFHVRGPPRKARLKYLPPELHDECNKQVDDLLNKGLIRPSKSPWCAAPVFAKKKNGRWRMAINYIPLNKQMVTDSYPIPLLWGIVQNAAGHRFYTLIDCNWGFWNIALEEGSIMYTAFICPRGIFEFLVLPFGIKNSPSIFQRAMDFVFGKLYANGTKIYVDDIVNYHNAWVDHIKAVRDCLTQCRVHQVYVNFYKIHFALPYVELLGHIYCANGIMPSPTKVDAILNSKVPQSKEELHSFLGLATYLSKFIPRYAEISSPLFDLLSKGVQFIWTKL